MLFESFEKVYDCDAIDEIVIVDDASEKEIYDKIEDRIKDYPKVKLFRNDKNIDCYFNKKKAIELSTNRWCILLDSDNVIDFSYLNKIFQTLQWEEDTIYTPSFATPTFDFRAYSGLTITKENISDWIFEPMFETMLNAANFFVNRFEYLKVWDGSVNPVTSDSIYFTYCWLKSGNKINVVDGMQYFHRVHSGSHYQNKNHLTPKGFHDNVLKRLKELK